MRAIELGTALVLVVSSAQATVQQKAAEDPCQSANRALAEHRYETARLQYETCLKQATPGVENLSNLGMAYAQLGLYREAIPLLYGAAQKTKSSETRLVLGEAFLGVKAYSSALKEFLAAEAASPETPGLHNDLGTAYAGLGQPDKAQAEFETQLA